MSECGCPKTKAKDAGRKAGPSLPRRSWRKGKRELAGRLRGEPKYLWAADPALSQVAQGSGVRDACIIHPELVSIWAVAEVALSSII